MSSLSDVKQPIAELMALGFSEYEAKAYCALMLESPATGYRIAKNSGVPQAKIYETITRLLERGAIEAADAVDSKGKNYVPIHFKQLLAKLENEFVHSRQAAEEKLKRLSANEVQVEVLWRILTEEDLLERAAKLIRGAKETLHIALWQTEFEALLPEIMALKGRPTKMALMLYGRHTAVTDLVASGYGVVEHNLNKGALVDVHGRQFVVVADGQECIAGTVFDNRIEGVFTANKGIVTNAMDLVNHEIYLERILAEVGAPVTDRFGRFLEKLVVFDPPAARVNDQFE